MLLSKVDLSAKKLMEGELPMLKNARYEITSPQTRTYNCIAWAAGDNTKWWWPTDAYWPGRTPISRSLSAFEMMFAAEGYSKCERSEAVPPAECVALYVDSSGMVTHAARLLEDGMWTSKIGSNFDISHTLESLEKGIYGNVGALLKRAPRKGDRTETSSSKST